MKLTKEILIQYEEEGWIRSQSHPTLPLRILNYTQKTQYESHWDEVTLNCRGLIIDSEYKVIVQPFGKFFNYEEIENQGKIPLSGDYVYVQDKMDGSLGILFWYESEWIMATRGSFTSDQAIRGLEIANRLFNLAAWEKSIAYACEIIYLENRIVVDYGAEEKLIFLSAFYNRAFYNNNTNDSELHWTTAKAFFDVNGIPYKYIVHTEQHFVFGTDLYKALKEMNQRNSEGFILRFHPSNYRMKIKFEDYVRLHRIITNISSYDVWENLMNNGTMDEETLKEVPDEFYSWIRKTEADLRLEYTKLENEYLDHFDSIKQLGTRKLFAQFVKNWKYPGILFNMLDDKDYSKGIWSIIKPKYERPFSDI